MSLNYEEVKAKLNSLGHLLLFSSIPNEERILYNGFMPY